MATLEGICKELRAKHPEKFFFWTENAVKMRDYEKGCDFLLYSKLLNSDKIVWCETSGHVLTMAIPPEGPMKPPPFTAGAIVIDKKSGIRCKVQEVTLCDAGREFGFGHWRASARPVNATKEFAWIEQAADKFISEETPSIAPLHHMAFYNGKAVVIDYVKDPKREFRVAAMRVADNLPHGASGHVLTPDNECFEVSKHTRTAKRVKIPAYIKAQFTARLGCPVAAQSRE